MFDFFSSQSAVGKLSTYIPKGTPTGIFRIRVINKNGASSLSQETITIEEALSPVPVVRMVSPSVVMAGYETRISITGGHFADPSAGVQLVAPDGATTNLTDTIWKSSAAITAVVDVPADFPEGRYDIRVLNSDVEYNELSVSKIELYHPVLLSASGGTVTTTGAVLVDGTPVPVSTLVKTDDRPQLGTVFRNPVRMKFYIEPGTTFSEQGQALGGMGEYSGFIMPPRQVLPSAFNFSTFGMDVVQFAMGAENLLRLKDGVTLFFTIEVILPSSGIDPIIYHVSANGETIPAGVAGMWRDIEIESGGTPLAVLQDLPEEGLTTYTYGLLLDHMSEYVLGLVNEEDASEVDDAYGSCMIGDVYSITGQGRQHHLAVLAVVLFVVSLCRLVTHLFAKLLPLSTDWNRKIVEKNS